jgi:hypothetical protein
VVLRDVVESFMFLCLGLLLLFVFVLDSLVYGVGVCLAGKPLPLVSQEGCRVALRSFNILDVRCRHPVRSRSPPASCADRQSSSSVFG